MIQQLGKVGETERNFGIVEFADYYGKPCTLQASSVIVEDYEGAWDNPGTSAIWLGGNERMHLSREQVSGLMARLGAWLATGSFELA